MAGKPWHRGAHPRIAKLVIAAANARPDYTCPTCGLTKAQGIALWGANGQWEGGHVVNGRTDLGERAEHIHCNRSKGASDGNAQRKPEPKITRWW